MGCNWILFPPNLIHPPLACLLLCKINPQDFSLSGNLSVSYFIIKLCNRHNHVVTRSYSWIIYTLNSLMLLYHLFTDQSQKQVTNRHLWYTKRVSPSIKTLTAACMHVWKTWKPTQIACGGCVYMTVWAEVVTGGCAYVGIPSNRMFFPIFWGELLPLITWPLFPILLICSDQMSVASPWSGFILDDSVHFSTTNHFRLTK